jgi:hypothetical protein
MNVLLIKVKILVLMEGSYRILDMVSNLFQTFVFLVSVLGTTRSTYHSSIGV